MTRWADGNPVHDGTFVRSLRGHEQYSRRASKVLKLLLGLELVGCSASATAIGESPLEGQKRSLAGRKLNHREAVRDP